MSANSTFCCYSDEQLHIASQAIAVSPTSFLFRKNRYLLNNIIKTSAIYNVSCIIIIITASRVGAILPTLFLLEKWCRKTEKKSKKHVNAGGKNINERFGVVSTMNKNMIQPCKDVLSNVESMSERFGIVSTMNKNMIQPCKDVLLNVENMSERFGMVSTGNKNMIQPCKGISSRVESMFWQKSTLNNVNIYINTLKILLYGSK